MFIKPTIIDPDDDEIEKVVQRIEDSSKQLNMDIKQRTRPNYEPKFKFLDGETKDLRDMNPYEEGTTEPDNKSPIPVLF